MKVKKALSKFLTVKERCAATTENEVSEKKYRILAALDSQYAKYGPSQQVSRRFRSQDPQTSKMQIFETVV